MSELVQKLAELKRGRNAVILAHNYQRPEVQDVADFVGDSLELSKKAAASTADVIVFCGVYFMAETAAILAPGRTVIIPDENAGCPMANMITPRELENFKLKHPGAEVVCYVNSTAKIKAMSDICCTSSNAVEVMKSVPAGRDILFVPDASLGTWAANQAGRKVVVWDGYCPSHHRILAEHIKAAKSAYPDAEVIVHPECTEDVKALADAVLSTGAMLRHCKRSNNNRFIIGTEIGMIYPLRKQLPAKKFYPATPLADCPNMKLTTVEKIVWALEDMRYQVTVPDDVADAARKTITRMFELG